MSRIIGIAPVLPDFAYTQAEISEELGSFLTADVTKRAVMARLHAGTGIGTRYTALPIEAYRDLASFGASNDHWIRVGTDLAERAVRHALVAAGLQPHDVDHLFFTSVTGLSAPSIDARIIPRLGLRPDIKRVPSFGLGCVAGASGLARVHDYLLGRPRDIAVLLSVELCSLTVQRGDDSMANFVASGLFGDGAAAVVIAGAERAAELGIAGPEIVDTRSGFYPDTANVIGWDVRDTGFQIMLSAGVPEAIEANFEPAVRSFLADHDLTVADISAWVAHPGGPRVLEAFAASLGLPDSAFATSWESLNRVGNLSSASVLHVLSQLLEQPPGTNGLLFALGPGVSAELVLLRWAA
jgi:alkylresorcinol/alkylpyrone synthase